MNHFHHIHQLRRITVREFFQSGKTFFSAALIAIALHSFQLLTVLVIIALAGRFF